MTRLSIEIPDELMSQLENSGYPVQEIVLKALERYIQAEDTAIDITKTKTWELCGAFEVAEPASKYVTGEDEQNQVITNYAENVDDVLYGSN